MRRARLFSAILGFLLALAGIVLDNRLLVWSAMVVLAVALAMRLWLRRREARPADFEREGGT
jgi:hypothetical protein